MMRHMILATAIACLAACTPGGGAKKDGAPAPVEATGPQPSAVLAAGFPGCTWSEASGGGVAMWGFDCATAKTVGDAALPGLVRESTDDAGKTMRAPLVRVFAIADGAEMSTILPAVRAASPAPGASACAFEADPAVTDRYRLVPTGALKAQYQKFLDGKAEGPSMPCGELGPSEAGSRDFVRVSPTLVAAIYMPSDLPSFDAKTLRAAP